jgi:hypothetical protein
MNRVRENEQDVRVGMLNSFLSCPHRDTDKLKDVHLELQKIDPVFYSHLAAWYFKNGDIRDHKEVFVGALVCDTYHENREVGLALFRDLPTFLKRKVVGFVKGKKIKLRRKTGKKILKGKRKVDEITIEEKTVGLFKNIPTSFRNDIRAFLNYIETETDIFDSIVIRNKNDLKGLYATLHIAPSNRAEEILFKSKYPEDSKLNVFQQIADTKSPAKVARLIVENKIPYTVAVGLVEKVTPSILVALINAMSPQEVINNYASLEEKGAMKNEDTKKLITEKLEKAKKSKSVSALKSKQAVKTGRVKDENSVKILEEIADTQIKKRGVIKVDTAIFIDKSGSMQTALEVGKSVSSLVSGATEANLIVVAFDTAAREIVAEEGETGMSAWERAFKPLHAHGGTSIGSALDFLMRKGRCVEQIVIITDEDENTDPWFADTFKKYELRHNITPTITIIYMKTNWGNKKLSQSLKLAKIAFDYYEPEGDDYYALPGLIPLLSRKSKLDLLYEIMDTPLPKRKDFGKKKKAA